MTALPSWLFATPLPGIARPLTEAEGDQLRNYLILLTKWQKTHRLIGSVEPAWIIENVFVHSLCFLEALPPNVGAVADLGSGAGIPGIPVAIVRPDLRIALIEAKGRRVSFLSTVVRELSLRHVEVIAGRVESLGTANRGHFDAVLMRCAGPVADLLDDAFGLLANSGGVVVVSAGPSEPEPAQAEVIVVRAPSGALRTLHRYAKPAIAN